MVQVKIYCKIKGSQYELIAVMDLQTCPQPGERVKFDEKLYLIEGIIHEPKGFGLICKLDKKLMSQMEYKTLRDLYDMDS